MKHRALCCLLIAVTLVVHSVSLLPLQGTAIEQLFSYSWLTFAAFVICGNFLQLVPKKRDRRSRSVSNAEEKTRNLEEHMLRSYNTDR